MKPDGKKKLRAELHALATREGLTPEMLVDLIHEWKERQMKKRINNMRGYVAAPLNGSPVEMYCFRDEEFVQLVDGKCYKWKDGCRACAFSGYRDTDSYRLI